MPEPTICKALQDIRFRDWLKTSSLRCHLLQPVPEADDCGCHHIQEVGLGHENSAKMRSSSSVFLRTCKNGCAETDKLLARKERRLSDKLPDSFPSWGPCHCDECRVSWLFRHGLLAHSTSLLLSGYLSLVCFGTCIDSEKKNLINTITCGWTCERFCVMTHYASLQLAVQIVPIGLTVIPHSKLSNHSHRWSVEKNETQVFFLFRFKCQKLCTNVTSTSSDNSTAAARPRPVLRPMSRLSIASGAFPDSPHDGPLVIESTELLSFFLNQNETDIIAHRKQNLMKLHSRQLCTSLNPLEMGLQTTVDSKDITATRVGNVLACIKTHSISFDPDKCKKISDSKLTNKVHCSFWECPPLSSDHAVSIAVQWLSVRYSVWRCAGMWNSCNKVTQNWQIKTKGGLILSPLQSTWNTYMARNFLPAVSVQSSLLQSFHILGQSFRRPLGQNTCPSKCDSNHSWCVYIHYLRDPWF